jgi:hypothetical protein
MQCGHDPDAVNRCGEKAKWRPKRSSGMYVSPAVRSIRDRPIEGESITLLVRAADDIEAVVDQLKGIGGTVERRLEFDTVAVTVAQTDIAVVCELDGVESIETEQTLTMDPDGAGEDVTPPDE